jgi:hypothetical protein
MPVGRVRMVGGSLMIAVVVVLGSFVMVMRRLLVVFGGRAMVFSTFVSLHDGLPFCEVSPAFSACLATAS